MVKFKHRGKRSKTRHKFKKSVRQKGLPSINVLLQKFDKGDRVHVKVNPSIHSAMPQKRFDGKTGVVTGKRGDCYLVKVKNIRAERIIIVHPAHLKKQR